VALLVCLTVHEFAHAKSAELSGDDTARLAGRISLNPIDHLDPLGTIMMVFMAISGVGFGWAKPVPINPLRFRHPRWDSVKVSLWGPLSNVLFALALGVIIRFLPVMIVVKYPVLLIMVQVNLTLAFFNLIPIPPLDGSHIFSGLLPAEQARSYDRLMGQYGMFILIMLMISGRGVLRHLIGVPVAFLFRLFIGI
jgi:Zn-dependent protease